MNEKRDKRLEGLAATIQDNWRTGDAALAATDAKDIRSLLADYREALAGRVLLADYDAQVRRAERAEAMARALDEDLKASVAREKKAEALVRELEDAGIMEAHAISALVGNPREDSSFPRCRCEGHTADLVALLRRVATEAARQERERIEGIVGDEYRKLLGTIKMFREAEAENAALIQTSGDLCEACGWRGKRGGSCAFCENAALRAELALEEAGSLQADRVHTALEGYKKTGESLSEAVARLRAERDRLRQSRDGMLREAVRALEHWLAKGAKVVWTPYLTPSACRELLRAAGFYGADQLEHARAALASGEESQS